MSIPAHFEYQPLHFITQLTHMFRTMSWLWNMSWKSSASWPYTSRANSNKGAMTVLDNTPPPGRTRRGSRNQLAYVLQRSVPITVLISNWTYCATAICSILRCTSRFSFIFWFAKAMKIHGISTKHTLTDSKFSIHQRNSSWYINTRRAVAVAKISTLCQPRRGRNDARQLSQM